MNVKTPMKQVKTPPNQLSAFGYNNDSTSNPAGTQLLEEVEKDGEPESQ